MILAPLIALVLSTGYTGTFLSDSLPSRTVEYKSISDTDEDNAAAADTSDFNPDAYDTPCDEEEESYVTCKEYKSLWIRQNGLDFFTRHPKDQRRWEWLILTTRYFPHYFSDIARLKELEKNDSLPWAPIDTVKRAAWERRYRTLREEFFATASSAMQRELYAAETSQIQIESQDACARGETVDLGYYNKLVLDWAALLARLSAGKESDDQLKTFGVQSAAHFGMDSQCARKAGEVTTREFVNAAARSPLKALRELALVQQQFMGYRTTPMPLHWVTMSGRPLDARQLRGKVVIIDFWATTCSGCIAAFPKLKKLYDKYHPKGLDIVTIALDNPKDRGQAEKIIARFGLPWHQVFWPRSDQFVTSADGYIRYKIAALPYKFVLDPQGHLILYGHVADSEIEQVLHRYLDTRLSQLQP